jgi:heme exporter protein C
MVGLVMVPVIFWSINCPDPNACAALHQRSGLGKIESNILFAMLSMTLGFWMYSFATTFMRLRSIILTREAETSWAQDIIRSEARVGMPT